MKNIFAKSAINASSLKNFFRHFQPSCDESTFRFHRSRDIQAVWFIREVRAMYSIKFFLAVLFLIALPLPADAESQFTTVATTPAKTSAKLDFQIEIPKILFLRVGAGADYTTNSNVDLILFNVNAANVANGSAVAATAASGNLGNGAVTARVVGNNGTITFTSTTAGALKNGAGDSISHGQIVAAVSTLTTATSLAHPALADATTTTVLLTPASGKLIDRDAAWTFS